MRGAWKLRRPNNYADAVNFARLKDSIQHEETDVEDLLQTITTHIEGTKQPSKDQPGKARSDQVAAIGDYDCEDWQSECVANVYKNPVELDLEMTRLREEIKQLKRTNKFLTIGLHSNQQ